MKFIVNLKLISFAEKFSGLARTTNTQITHNFINPRININNKLNNFEEAH